MERRIGWCEWSLANHVYFLCMFWNLCSWVSLLYICFLSIKKKKKKVGVSGLKEWCFLSKIVVFSIETEVLNYFP